MAPQARENSVRLRRLLDSAGRPLNFAVRQREDLYARVTAH